MGPGASTGTSEFQNRTDRSENRQNSLERSSATANRMLDLRKRHLGISPRRMAFDLVLFVEQSRGWSPSTREMPMYIVLLAQEDPEFPLDENRHSHHAHLAFYRRFTYTFGERDSFSLSSCSLSLPPRRRGSLEHVQVFVCVCVRARVDARARVPCTCTGPLALYTP